MKARPVAAGFSPYAWASTAEEIAAKQGLDVAQVLRFDANVPPLPGVPPVPVGRSFSRLNEYPEGTYSALREAAAAYVGVQPEQIVVGAGADDLIHLVARTYLAPGRTASVRAPTYPVYAIASAVEGADVVAGDDAADVIWICNPDNPTGALLDPQSIAQLARDRPHSLVVVDEAYFEYGGATVVPLLAEVPNLVAIRTLSKAFGFAALRVGYAVASAEVARELTSRRAPAPIAAPAADIAAAALLEPQLDVHGEIEERERLRAALLEAGYECAESAANFVYVPLPNAAAVADELERAGLVVRRFPDAIRITVRLPAENDLILAALDAAPPPGARRSALVVRTTAESAVRVSLDLDGRGRARIETGVGFLDHLLTQVAFHGNLDLDVRAGGDLDVDQHHVVEDVLAALGAALAQALGERNGVARYGSATVPMDEARAVAAVDLVRRAHAEIAIALREERIGDLAATLLPHALERFVSEAAVTLHLQAGGTDDHHVAEAAFKALGRALGEACAHNGAVGVRSTKGAA